jgi:hypothetical protein
VAKIPKREKPWFTALDRVREDFAAARLGAKGGAKVFVLPAPKPTRRLGTKPEPVAQDSALATEMFEALKAKQAEPEVEEEPKVGGPRRGRVRFHEDDLAKRRAAPTHARVRSKRDGQINDLPDAIQRDRSEQSSPA